MRCPDCGADDTRVVDSRSTHPEHEQIRRRRECRECGYRFTTFERRDYRLPRVVKRNGERVVFDESKLRAGMSLALHKRPVRAEQEDAAIERIKRRLSAHHDREIRSARIGEWVMEELRMLDQVAYIRFASIYLSFNNVQAFRETIERLEQDLTPEMRRSQLPLIDPDPTDFREDSDLNLADFREDSDPAPR